MAAQEFPQYRVFHAGQTEVDFAITLGGDGTVLYLASQFDGDDPLPPVMCFAMGTLVRGGRGRGGGGVALGGAEGWACMVAGVPPLLARPLPCSCRGCRHAAAVLRPASCCLAPAHGFLTPVSPPPPLGARPPAGLPDPL